MAIAVSNVSHTMSYFITHISKLTATSRFSKRNRPSSEKLPCYFNLVFPVMSDKVAIECSTYLITVVPAPPAGRD